MTRTRTVKRPASRMGRPPGPLFGHLERTLEKGTALQVPTGTYKRHRVMARYVSRVARKLGARGHCQWNAEGRHSVAWLDQGG